MPEWPQIIAPNYFFYRFLWWYITVHITGFLDPVHHLVLQTEHNILENVSLLRLKVGEYLLKKS
jgi:hypothetical protein